MLHLSVSIIRAHIASSVWIPVPPPGEVGRTSLLKNLIGLLGTEPLGLLVTDLQLST